MTLVDVYESPKLWSIPYLLLEEREPHQNISHRAMPTYAEHCAFMLSQPYLAWYLIQDRRRNNTGCVYLSKQREIGVGVLKEYRGQGLGKEAIAELMRLHPGKFYANVAPGNHTSHLLFESIGFTPLQVTYTHE